MKAICTCERDSEHVRERAAGGMHIIRVDTHDLSGRGVVGEE